MQLEKNNNHQQCPVKGEGRNLAVCVISKQSPLPSNLSIQMRELNNNERENVESLITLL